MEPGKFGTDMPLLTAKQFQIPQPATIQEARENGAVEGTVLAAPLAPSKGPIDAPAESLVVVTVKKFWDSKTAKAIKAVLIAAFASVVIVFGSTCLTVWSSGKSIFDAGAIDWRNTERACEIAGGGVIVAGVMAWARKRDNNPVQ
jgi:hypothetical protein